MKQKYKAYSYTLNDQTATLLKKKKEASGKSWNLFIYDLIKDTEKNC